MRVETLPSPGLLASGLRLRVEASKAISAVEINAGIPANAGVSSSADQLFDFFNACASSVVALRDVTAPLVVARSATPSNVSLIVLTYDGGLSKGNVPDVTAFAVTGQVRTVTKVEIDGPFVFLSLNAPLVAGAVSVAYTQPVDDASKLQDASDNFAASFAATAVVNTIV